MEKQEYSEIKSQKGGSAGILFSMIIMLILCYFKIKKRKLMNNYSGYFLESVQGEK